MEEIWYKCNRCGADETATTKEQVARMNRLCRRCARAEGEDARKRVIFTQGMLGRN